MRAAAAAAVACAGGCAGSDFGAWRARYGKTYAAAEEATRRACFARSAAAIAELNAAGGGATFGFGPFADMCPEEFAAQRVGKPMGICTMTPKPVYNKPADAATSVDWRTKGAVTAVKDQGQCGSCWSFSATGNMEAQWFLKKGELLEFSEQELVSCDKIANGGLGDMGCMGGGFDTAWNWVVKNGGIDTEQDYPYVSGVAGDAAPKCDKAKMATKAATFSGHLKIPDHNETAQLAALQNEGPVSITVYAAGATWQHYQGGIVTSCPGAISTDHAVLAVGYGHDGEQAYWIVKNSWGADWGESGYIRLAFGKNICALSSCLSGVVQV